MFEKETLFTEFTDEEFAYLQNSYADSGNSTLLEAVDQDYQEYINYSYKNFVTEELEEKLVILDGSSILTTAFHGNLPTLYANAETDEEKKRAAHLIMNADGVYVNAIYTALRIIFNDILPNSKATHLAVTLDLTRNSFRKKIYPDYKGNRKETDPILKSQFPLFKEILESAGIKVFESKESDDEIYEADDFTGSISTKFSNAIKTYIYTKDQDHFQLLNEQVFMWAKLDYGLSDTIQDKCLQNNIPFNTFCVPNSCFEYSSKNILGLKNLTPDIVVDTKALAGDSSDNIPGVKGISQLTAAELMMKYKTIENLYNEIDKLNGDKKALKAFGDELKREVITTSRTPINALIKYRKEAFLSKELSAIKRDINIDCTLEDLRLNINKENLIKQLDKYKMHTLKSLV